MTIFNYLKKNKESFPNKLALYVDEQEYTFLEIFELVKLAIKNLKLQKFSKKSIVILIEGNTLNHIISIFALSYIGAIVIPLGKYYNLEQLKNIIKISNANSLISDSENCKTLKNKIIIKKFISTTPSKKKNYLLQEERKKIKLPKETKNVDSSFILTFSSGSTSQPKPIIFSQKTKIQRFKLFKKLYRVNKNDNIIVTCPIDHSLGMRLYFLPLLAGCSCVIMDNFEKYEYFKLLKKYNISFSTLVSNQIYEILSKKNLIKHLKNLRVLISASAKLYPNDKKQILKNKINLHEMYGASEIGTVTSINFLKEKKHLNSVGKIYDPKIKIKILSAKNKFLNHNEVGEIICKTPAEFKKYLNIEKKKSFYKNYFKTGDLGFFDKNNYLHFVSGKKNVIRRNGISIFPEDIEKIIIKDKKIIECVVVGKSTKKIKKIYLFVKVKKDINLNYINKLCLKKLPMFQLPNKIVVVENFPKTNLGKIQKYKLKKLI